MQAEGIKLGKEFSYPGRFFLYSDPLFQISKVLTPNICRLIISFNILQISGICE